MLARFALVATLFVATLAPVIAQSSTQGLAPADEYFGRFGLSVLGVSNTIRDAGFRLDTGADARTVIDGPLSFATDALRAWEARYPSDPWIPKDLYALECAYLKAHGDDAFRLASKTATWLVTDYPSSAYAGRAKQQLASAGGAATQSGGGAWERFAALRVPIAPR